MKNSAIEPLNHEGFLICHFARKLMTAHFATNCPSMKKVFTQPA